MTTPIEQIEQAIIGAAILDPLSLDIAAGIVSSADFADTALGRVFSLMLDMHGAGEPVGDHVLLASRLQVTDHMIDGRRAGDLLAAIGGMSGLGRIALACGNVKSVQAYAEAVHAAAGRRRLKEVAANLAERAEDELGTPAEIAAWVDAQLTCYQSGADRGSVSIADATREALQDIAAGQNSTGVRRLLTGFKKIDGFIGGLYPNDLCILAARPSIGKSALAAQIAIQIAECGNHVLFVSLEMSPRDIALRQLAARLHYEVRVLRAGGIEREDVSEGERYIDELASVPMRLWAQRSATVGKIRAAARIHRATTGLDLLVVDYLGLIEPNDPRKPRWESIGEVSKKLKDLAQELSIPVLALCQLGRDAEGKVPDLHHLRDAGAIEQDADLVMLLHRESRDATSATLNVAKMRNGAIGVVDLAFDPESVQFSDPDEAIDMYREFA